MYTQADYLDESGTLHLGGMEQDLQKRQQGLTCDQPVSPATASAPQRASSQTLGGCGLLTLMIVVILTSAVTALATVFVAGTAQPAAPGTATLTADEQKAVLHLNNQMDELLHKHGLE